MNNILITGYPGVGKTTLINKIKEKLSCKSDGFYTHEKREKGRRTGFYITDFCGNQMVMADVNLETQYRVSKYGVNIDAFEKIGVNALEKGLKHADIIIIDEIGKMEMFSKKFCSVLMKVLDSEKPVLATIKKRDCKLTAQIKARHDVKIYEITVDNRYEMLRTILGQIEKI